MPERFDPATTAPDPTLPPSLQSTAPVEVPAGEEKQVSKSEQRRREAMKQPRVSQPRQMVSKTDKARQEAQKQAELDKAASEVTETTDPTQSPQTEGQETGEETELVARLRERGVIDGDSLVLDKMTDEELTSFATANGVEVKEGATREEVMQAIEAAFPAEQTADENQPTV